MTQQHQCRCETCEHKGKYTPFGSDCPLNGYEWSAFQIECITMHIGCASHPANTGALARIDAGVKELEWRIDHPTSKAFEPHSHDCDIVNAAYASAIALLKEGVGK
jgi:hypothetical protein